MCVQAAKKQTCVATDALYVVRLVENNDGVGEFYGHGVADAWVDDVIVRTQHQLRRPH